MTTRGTQILSKHNMNVLIAANDRLAQKEHPHGDTWMACDIPYLAGKATFSLGQFILDPTTKNAGDVLNFMSMLISRRNDNK